MLRSMRCLANATRCMHSWLRLFSLSRTMEEGREYTFGVCVNECALSCLWVCPCGSASGTWTFLWIYSKIDTHTHTYTQIMCIYTPTLVWWIYTYTHIDFISMRTYTSCTQTHTYMILAPKWWSHILTLHYILLNSRTRIFCFDRDSLINIHHTHRHSHIS